MIKKILKNEKGSFAIISVILVFIILTAVAAYTDMISKRWVINEVQSIMDASGTNTLKTNVNLDKLYKEKFGNDSVGYADLSENEKGERLKRIVDGQYKSKIKDAYVNEISQQVRVNENIKELDVQQVNVSFDYDAFGLGKSSKPRPQFTIDAVTKIKIKTSSLLDGMDGASASVYSSRNNANFQVQYQGKSKDGYSELLVRSVTRLVYR